MIIESEIYKQLLDNLGLDNEKFEPEDMKANHPTKAKYYVKNIADNCFDEPHSKLDSSARAVYSSVTMIYNLFGKNVIIDGKKYQVEYEEELKAIVPSNGRYETHKAHLDASLRCDNEIIFCEAKLKEWFGSPKKLAASYLKPECYFEDTTDKNLFINFFKSIIDMKSLNAEGKYKSIYKRYDAIQMTIHILGIYNYVKEQIHRQHINKITLINCVWGYDVIPEYEVEKKEATEFIKLANKEFKKIFDEIGVEFEIKYYSFHELKDKIDFSADKERLEYLKRYDVNINA